MLESMLYFIPSKSTDLMKMFRPIATGWIWILMAMMTMCVSTATRSLAQSTSNAALEFRIDTDVYIDSTRPPVASTQTLFVEGRIIDWDDAQRRMMRIDLTAQQIELADFANQRRCRIDMKQLESRLSDLRTQLTQEQIEAWASSREPVEDQGAMLLESRNLRYRFKTIAPRQPAMAIAYADFANWSVQVSAIYPPYKPPLLRLQLNEYLAQNGMLPTEIQLTDLRSQSKDTLTARILVQDSLTAQDRERVKDWDVLVQTLKLVSDAEFFQSDRVARQRTSNTK
jgi:hypothetical protein